MVRMSVHDFERNVARILIVEDEALLALDLAQSLRDFGYEVAGTAARGDDAVRKALECKPDLMLMDINLQGELDGIDAYSQIREHLDIPVVYLTGYSERDVLERAKKTEPYGYLGKPISLAELRSTLETALYKHEADKRVRESEERLRSIVDSLHDLVFVLNREGIFTDCHFPPNLQFKLYLPPEEFIGRHYKDVLPRDVSQLLEAAIDSLEQTKVSHQFDYSIAMAGVNEWYSAKVSRRKDIRGRCCGVTIVCRDITERKKAERDLLEREALIRSISDNLPSGMIYQVTGQMDGNRQFSYVSGKVRDFYGCSPEEAIADAGLIYGRIHPEDRQRVFLEEEEALESLSNFRTEARVINPSGDVRWSYVASSPVRLEDGSTYWSGLEIDITERKQSEEALRESEQRFRSLIEQASDALFVHDLEGKFLEVNQQASISLGYSVEELLSMSVSDIDPDIENRGDRVKYWENLPATFEARLRRKDGTAFLVEIRLGPIEYGEAKVVLAMVRDITDRKMTEKVLQENEDRCRTIFQTSPDAISITRLRDRVYVEINDRFTELTGFTKDEVIGKTSLAFNIWNDSSDRDRLVAGLRERGQVTNLEAQFRLKDGRVRTGLMSARTICLNGEPHILSVTRDVEDLQKVEEDLRQKTSLLNSLIEALPDSVHFKDINRRHLLTNKAYEDFFGLSRHEAVGKTIEELVTSNNVEQSRESDEAVIETTQPIVQEHCWFDERLDKHIFETRKFPIVDADGVIFAVGGISRDITHLKRREEEIKASLAEKGVLLREIHHRVKNNLAVVSSLLRLQARYTEDETVRSMFEESEARIRAMALAHAQLYQTEDLSQINAGQYLSSLFTSLRSFMGRLGRNILTKSEFEDINLQIDTAIPLGFIVTELVSNVYKHAFPEGRRGELELTLRSIGNHECELVVQDDGVGMPGNLDLKHPKSCGLTLVDVFVKQINGVLEVRAVGGTEVRVRFSTGT
jgi:PAS domain S-box-containing protein